MHAYIFHSGVAAANLGFNARTYQGLLKINTRVSGVESADVNQKKLSVADLTFLQRDLADLRILIIDEISFIDAASIWAIHCRLCEVFTPGSLELPFGGKCVVAMGDAYQLPPCKGMNLFSHMALRARKLYDREIQPDSASERGVQLWQRFRKIDFVAQNRSVDAEHTALLNRFRDNPTAPISERERQAIQRKIITAEDFKSDPSWEDAPIIVTSNKMRHMFNLYLAKRFAKRHGVPVICWRLKLANRAAQACSQAELDTIYDCYDPLKGYFVAGGPCFMNGNMNAPRGLANGTAAFMRRLIFSDPEVERQVQALIAQAVPGQVLVIPVAPDSILVNVPSVSPRDWAGRADEALQDLQAQVEGLLVPLEPIKYSKPLVIGHGDGQSVWKYFPSSCELGFAITFHKGKCRFVFEFLLHFFIWFLLSHYLCCSSRQDFAKSHFAA